MDLENLTTGECDELINMLENKKHKNNIQWLINTYHIDKPFYCLTHGYKTYVTNYNQTIHYTIEYPSRHDLEGWESTITIFFVDDIVVNVVYTTDRYMRYDYNDKEFPQGEFQGKNLGLFYDSTKLGIIRAEIDEIKELITYLI